MKLALKIDVNTWRGTRLGVPRLLEILQRHAAQATFLFNLGPDCSGRASRHTLPTARRLPALRNYGAATLLYGGMLPAPDVSQRGAEIMRDVRDRGFEVGIHAWNRVLWQQRVASADADWSKHQMQLACRRFESVFATPARVHGAAGWRMNRHVWRLTQRLGFAYSSDTRGSGPFIPVRNGEIIACPQLPTTLPTLDELIASGDSTPELLIERLLLQCAQPPSSGHVYTLRAEIEGMAYAPLFEQLLAGWRAQGYVLVSLQEYFSGLSVKALPRCAVADMGADGHAGLLATQGGEFLA